MLLLVACIRSFHNGSIRRFSNRQYFANLKKFYRSTSSPIFMASSNPTCFVFDKDEGTKILIQIVYEINSNQTRRQFNLLRSVDEPLSQTIRRLTTNIEQATKKEKKQKKRPSSPNQQEPIEIQLFDEHQQKIDENLFNQQAWINARQLKINEQTYQIQYNAPAVLQFRFPDVIMTNTITIAQVELDYGDWKHSLFDWYVADDLHEDIDQIQWIHVHRGPFCTFSDQHQNKFVRLTCLPRNSSLREGMPAEHRSKTRIIPCPIDLPMDIRHQLTQEKFPVDSSSLRLVSYNILANGYASSTDAGDIIFPHCPPQFLDHSYRKPLLLREIVGYNADIIFLQECDTRFYERELTSVLNHFGYEGQMKIKSVSVREGEAIFYRTDRFTFLDNHDVTLGEYLRNSDQTEYLRERFAVAEEISNSLLERNTALQVVALQPHGRPNDVFLVCNTHLYFHPLADVVRCFQAMIGLERIREMKNLYEQRGKKVSVIWSGDFNANVTSLAFQLLFTGTLVTDTKHRSYNEVYATLINNFQYKTPFELSTYSNYAYTNYMPHFHGVIDHIFYDAKRFEFERAIPMPTHDEVTKFVALPSCQIPSDHLAVVIDVKIIE